MNDDTKMRIRKKLNSTWPSGWDIGEIYPEAFQTADKGCMGVGSFPDDKDFPQMRVIFIKLKNRNEFAGFTPSIAYGLN